jgi:hypothetical protein
VHLRLNLVALVPVLVRVMLRLRFEAQLLLLLLLLGVVLDHGGLALVDYGRERVIGSISCPGSASAGTVRGNGEVFAFGGCECVSDGPRWGRRGSIFRRRTVD